ncbi:MAG: DUF2975 domain-containing protein [Oscillospiraceae bacterium]|jgi:hypothetical protein|nr:DUF2975 domain-containing protein [Oscillospiraceae bacterium]
MSAKSLGMWVRFAVLCMFLCGLLACVWILPYCGAWLAWYYPEFAYAYIPWLIFIWITFAPCAAILALGWKVAGAISRDEAFTMKTAQWVKMAAMLLFIAIGIFFAGNILFLLLNMSHPTIVLIALFACMIGIAIAIIAVTLARYVTKAAVLQEEAEGTL